MPNDLAKYSNPDGVVPDRTTWTPWLKAWRMLIDAKYHGDIYEAFLGMEAPVFARAYYQVRSHPNGRKLFKHKPDLLSVLGDVDYLSSLPFGSLGHAYLSFLNTNKLDAGVFGESSIIRPWASPRMPMPLSSNRFRTPHRVPAAESHVTRTRFPIS
ncbi:Uncharacterized protein involved in ubiquinone biosynthesis [Mycobacteroides abscessus]|nr:Uncharacterized protein involved in ubiquinone biosynthesis [Mycobacteroides abscessus]